MPNRNPSANQIRLGQYPLAHREQIRRSKGDGFASEVHCDFSSACSTNRSTREAKTSMRDGTCSTGRVGRSSRYTDGITEATDGASAARRPLPAPNLVAGILPPHSLRRIDRRHIPGPCPPPRFELPRVLRPIFQTAGFEDIDETCFYGAYIGGMAATYEDAGIATSYMRAANMLVGQALRDDCVHEVVLAALFLYRHALELRLKFPVRPDKLNHGLGRLVRELNELLVTKRGAGLACGVIDRGMRSRGTIRVPMHFGLRIGRRKVRRAGSASLRKSG
jgi:hypothetical protein